MRVNTCIIPQKKKCFFYELNIPDTLCDRRERAVVVSID